MSFIPTIVAQPGRMRWPYTSAASSLTLRARSPHQGHLCSRVSPRQKTPRLAGCVSHNLRSTQRSVGYAQPRQVSDWLWMLTAIHSRARRRPRHYHRSPQPRPWLMTMSDGIPAIIGHPRDKGAREITPRGTLRMTQRKGCPSGTRSGTTRARRTSLYRLIPLTGLSVW